MHKLTPCLCLIFILSSVGCSRSQIDTQDITQWAEIYQTTLISYLEQDTALNENIQYIAIDFSTLEFASDDDKLLIRTIFGINHLPVVDTNLERLQSEGLFNEEGMYITDGILLSIIKVTVNNNEIIIEGTKYRGALGANWFETKWRLNNDIWEFTETVMTMIS